MAFVTSNISSNGIFTEWLNAPPFTYVSVLIASSGSLSGVMTLDLTYDGGTTVYHSETWTITATDNDYHGLSVSPNPLPCQLRLGIVNATDHTAGSAVVVLGVG